MSPRFMIHADQYQQRIEGDGRKGIRGHPLHFAFVVHGDDSHSGRETSHRLSKVFLIGSHGCPESEFYHEPRISAVKPVPL
jgi:hypothetical protein